MTDIPGAFRTVAVRRVGGFDDQMQVKEDTDLIWRLQQHGYLSIRRKDGEVSQIKGRKTFTIAAHLERSFAWGYWYHMLYSVHPRKVGIGGWPVKLLAGVVLIIFSSFSTVAYLALVPLITSTVLLRFIRVRTRVKLCLLSTEGLSNKILAFSLSIILIFLEALSFDLGKVLAIGDRLLGIRRKNLR